MAWMVYAIHFCLGYRTLTTLHTTQIIPRSVLENAKGFAIFTVFKAGFLFSARAGSGVVIARLQDGSAQYHHYLCHSILTEKSDSVECSKCYRYCWSGRGRAGRG